MKTSTSKPDLTLQPPPAGGGTPHRATSRLLRGLVLPLVFLVSACGGSSTDDIAGTYVAEDEGTIVVDADGTADLTQSGDPVDLTWERDGDTVVFNVTSGSTAEATLTDDGDLEFRPGDFSGDDPVTFAKE